MALTIGVPREVVTGETRVALVPESVGKLVKKLGYSVRLEAGAGFASGFVDEEYAQEGAEIVKDAAAVYASADILLKVQRPGAHPQLGKHELELMKKGALLISFFYGLSNPEDARKAAQAGVNVIGMDSIPRTTKAQRMDALSSQTNLAGYKAVLIAANALGKIFPLQMTAAGTITPARVVILGAGVAGLQAIATAKRLGAVVEVSDVRPETKEQVESLGGKFIEAPKDESLSGEGGYAKEASQDYLAKQQALLKKHIAEADAVITTALVPGKKAPVLVTKDMVDAMRPGSVVVDMAAEQGGNCEYSRPNETVLVKGVSVIGVVNLPASVPFHASQLYSRNILSLLEYITKEGKPELNLEDEIVKGSLLTHDGAVVHAGVKQLLG